MARRRRLTLETVSHDLGRADTSVRSLVPHVDGRSLLDLVDSHERRRGYDVPGSYAPLLVPREEFRGYLLGEREAWDGKVPLLGCTCGEWGCWPLLARVVVAAGLVEWRDVGQPHRPERDYERFGSFVFVERDYRAVVEAACADPYR
jgi:hypothetical protein